MSEEVQRVIEEIQKATSQLQKRTMEETSSWKEKVRILEDKVKSLQEALNDKESQNKQLRDENKQLQATIQSLETEQEKLLNELDDKNQTLTHYQDINLAVRAALEGRSPPGSPTSTQVSRYEPNSSRISPKKMDSKSPARKRVQVQENSSKSDSQFSETSNESVSESTRFIQKASDELDPDTFSEMIEQIDKYNKKEQTRYQTVSAIQSLICPEHQSLFYEFRSLIAD